MDVTDLTENELLVFVGLSRMLVNADDIVSLQELTWVRRLTDAIGRESWQHNADESKRRFGGLDGALSAAESIRSEATRAFFLEELNALAASDEVVEEEEALIAGLQAIWAD